MDASAAFPKSRRLLRRAEFVEVQTKGRRVRADHFLLMHIPCEVTRVGLTVSSRVGKAVVRNRVKRWIREYLRKHWQEVPAGASVIVARPSAAQVPHEVVDAELARLLRRARGGDRRG